MKMGGRLRAFGSFVRRGSFSDAAKELRISQPAVSKHIADMERDLGVTLVERRSRKLTAAGQFLANHVLRAEAILARAARGIADLRELGSTTLSIRASGTPGTYLLPEIVVAFQEAHPGVRLDFALGTSGEVVKAIRAQDAEIGVVGGFIAAPEIEAEPFTDDEIVIVGRPDYAGKRLTRDDLESLLWISREDGSATRVIADNALADLGIVPQRRLSLPSWEAIKLAVRRGPAIAACSRHAVSEELEAGTLVIIPFVPWKVRRMFSIVRIRDADLTPPAQIFVSMLRARWGRAADAKSRQIEPSARRKRS